MAVRYATTRIVGDLKDTLGLSVKKNLRECVYNKIVRLGVRSTDDMSMAGLTQIVLEGVEQLDLYYSSHLPQFFYAMLAPLLLFAITVGISWRVALVLLCCVPLIPLSIIAVSKWAKKIFAKYWGKYTSMGDSFLDSVQGLKELKIFGADAAQHRKMNETSEEFRKITMKVLVMQLASTTIMDLVAYGGAGLGIAMALLSVTRWGLSPIAALFLILVAVDFFLPLRAFGSAFHIAMNGMAASDKIFRILDISEPKAGEKTLPEGGLDISFRDVHFSYEKDREILGGIDLQVPAGSFVSLVGESGCGKSTIAGILSGKNREFSGDIRIGEMPLGDVREDDLMEHVVLVRHNSYLFKGTVRENLQMAKKDATDTEMRQVLKKVNLLGFLDTQNGLDTVLLEKAGNLSGGQCQRLAIARALLADAPVYIMDEATSNIDVESEELIMDVIHEMAKTRTVLLISHRLANVVQSDQIYFLKNGEIRECGKHEELMTLGGDYCHLYESQRALENYGKEGNV